MPKKKNYYNLYKTKIIYSKYVPSLSTHSCQRVRSILIPVSKKSLFKLSINSRKAFSVSLRSLKFFPLKKLSKCLNKWKSVGERSGEYGGCGSVSYFNSWSFLRVGIAICGLALSWRRIGPFRFTNAGQRFCNFLCILSISWQYVSAVIVSPVFRKL